MDLIDFARSEAKRQNIDPELIVRLINAESSGNPNAVSPKGATGIMQLMPGTAADMGVDINDPQDNIRGGVKYLAQQMERFGDTRLALAAYNAGPGNVEKYGGIPPFPETQAYVQKIAGNKNIQDDSDIFPRKKSSSPGGIVQTESNIQDDSDIFQKKIKRESPAAPEPIDTSNIPGLEPESEYDFMQTLSPADKFFAGLYSGTAGHLQGIGQRAGELLPENFSNKIGLPTKADVEARRKLDAPLKDDPYGATGNFIGAAAPLMAESLAVPGSGLLNAAATGALSGYLEPTGDNESVLQNIALGTAGGAGTYGAVKATKPIVSHYSHEVRDLADKAVKKYGIDLDLGRITGSGPMKWMSSIFSDLPATAKRQDALTEKVRRQFTRAVSRLFGQNTDSITEDVMSSARRKLGGEIGDIAARNTFIMDIDAWLAINRIKLLNSRSRHTKSVARIVASYANEFVDKADSNSEIPGKVFRRFDSELTRRIRKTHDGDLRLALTDLRDTLRDKMGRSILSADQFAWNEARKKYAIMKSLDGLVEKSVDGNIPPGQLLSAANEGFKDSAYQITELRELGKIGKVLLNDLPSSGSGQRLMYQKMFTSPLAVAAPVVGAMEGGVPGAAAGAMASSALSSGALGIPFQSAINNPAMKKFALNNAAPGILDIGLRQPLLKYFAGPGGATMALDFKERTNRRGRNRRNK